MEMVSKYFSMEETVVSEAGMRNGFVNIWPSTWEPRIRSVGAQMDIIRDLLGQPIHVNSWFRSPSVNRLIGGAVNSAHMQGFAVDFVCPGFGDCLEVCKKIDESGMRFDQLIHEFGWVHISFDDTRSGGMRQQKMTMQKSGFYLPGLLTKDECLTRMGMQ